MHERNIWLAGVLVAVAVAAVITYSLLSMSTVMLHGNTGNSEAQYSDLLQCVTDNKKLLINLRKDSTIPARERLLRVQFTKTRIAQCRDSLPRYLRYKDWETSNKINTATQTPDQK